MYQSYLPILVDSWICVNKICLFNEQLSTNRWLLFWIASFTAAWLFYRQGDKPEAIIFTDIHYDLPLDVPLELTWLQVKIKLAVHKGKLNICRVRKKKLYFRVNPCYRLRNVPTGNVLLIDNYGVLCHWPFKQNQMLCFKKQSQRFLTSIPANLVSWSDFTFSFVSRMLVVLRRT